MHEELAWRIRSIKEQFVTNKVRVDLNKTPVSPGVKLAPNFFRRPTVMPNSSEFNKIDLKTSGQLAMLKTKYRTDETSRL
jgi:hypothetical protein